MFVKTSGYIAEFTVADYLNYANKTNEIELINLGSKNLYKLYCNNIKYSNNNQQLVTEHKTSLDALLASYGQEVLVNVNNKQVRRLVLDINSVNYQELQDRLLGDFVFLHKASNQVIIVDVTNYDETSPNDYSTKYIRGKLLKLKKRCNLFKGLAIEVVGKGSQYLSILWNPLTDMDLLEFIDKCNEENRFLRQRYNQAKRNNEITEVAKVLTQIHTKTNIDLDNLSFDVTVGIY